MGRVLYSAMERMPGIRLADIRGGRFDNVICSKNCARVAVPLDRSADFEAFVRDFARVLKNEYAASDGGLSLTCRKAEVPEAMDVPATERMLHVLLALPQGVQAMNLKKGQRLLRAQVYQEGMLQNPNRYKKNLPALGALPEAGDTAGEQMEL